MSKIKIYKASAGSGKTYTLALEYIRELLISPSNENYRHILAVTFTRDATGEMKDRILAELYGLAFRTEDSAGFMNSMQDTLKESGYVLNEKQIQEKSKQVLQAILHDYSRLNITTIDSFFQKVLRNLARELGKGSKFNLEMNTNKVLQEAVHATIEKANQNKQLLAWLTTYIEHKMDDERNWRIEQDIFEFSQCIYAEFFQEHEKTLRQQLSENPQLFSELNKQQHSIQNDCKGVFKKIMERMNAVLDSRQLGLEDFGNSKYGILFITKLGNGDTAATQGSYVGKCRDDASFWGKAKHSRKAEMVDLAGSTFIPLLNEAIETLSVYHTSRMITGNLHQLGLIWDITKEITTQNAENNRFMLSDTAMFLNEMIDDSDAPFIYEKLGSDIHHVMIDEFQDTSRLQWKNFKALLSNILANDDFSLIVGDVKQSIYRWRNGDWRILNQIGNELQATVESLEYNYRSEKVVVDFNNAFFTSAAENLTELYGIKFGEAAQSPFLSTYNAQEVQQKTKKKTASGYVSIQFIPDKKDDTPYSQLMPEAVLEQLKKLQKAGIPANDICILTRTNKDIIVLADYLASLKNNYPEMAESYYLSTISDEAFQLKSSLAVKILIEALKVISDPENVINQAQLNYLLGVHGARYTVHDARHTGFRLLPLFELVGYLYRFFNLEQIEGQSAYLFAFYDYIAKYLNDKPGDLPNFLQYWEEELKYKAIPTGSGVSGIRAMTIHKSKGLQFPTVIIPYCDWNINPKANNTTVWCGPKEGWYDAALLPVAYSNTMSETVFAPEYEDETSQSWMDNLNVLYVGFTRAEQNLILLAKNKKTLEVIDQITTVSDLLQLSVAELDGTWDEENKHFEKGALEIPSVHRAPCTVHLSDNPLKQTPPPYEITFVSKEFQPEKSIFKQSNQSREFVAPPREDGRLYGNIMHNLFEQITRFDTIEKAIDNLIIQGLLQPDEKERYAEKIRSAIQESKVESWFSGEYKSYQEHSIITEENGEVVSKRPDRVLLSEDSTIVIDYKFGKAHPEYKKQVKQYMDLLADMNYPNVEGYLWYVEERRVEKID
jgi:ATP-dependent exoDNAse (exonuclease V) beta subunit